MEENKLTFGQKEVGLSFNPSGNDNVTKIKTLYAEIIDLLNDERGERRDNGARHLSTAMTDALRAQMMAVKGLTWED